MKIKFLINMKTVLIIFIFILLFFTFFGKTLYYSTKPHVKVQALNNLTTIEGVSYIQAPKACVFDGSFVYVIEFLPGFSRQTERAIKKEIEFNDYDKENILVINGIKSGDIVITEVTTDGKELTDGIRVVVK